MVYSSLSTWMNFFSERSGLPQEKLYIILGVEAGLDTLYMQVLSNAAHDHNVERVIGTVVLLHRPLSITFLGQLLQLQVEHIVHSLLGTQSILMVPEDDDQTIQPLDTALADFLKVESHSNNFFINPPCWHLSIMTDCLAVIMVDPTEGIFYSGGQLYACTNWCYHCLQSFCEGREEDVLDVLAMASVMHYLEDISSTSSLDLWVNTLIYQGWMQTLDDLTSLLARLQVCSMCDSSSI